MLNLKNEIHAAAFLTAAGNYLTSWGPEDETPWTAEMLADKLEQDDMEDIVVYEQFEDESADRLYQLIEDAAEINFGFAQRILAKFGIEIGDDGEPVKKQKARPILANSAPRILQPMESRLGTLQVKWNEEDDVHELWLDSRVMLASHNNGFSCHSLAKRIIEGDPHRIEAQAEYIAECGGNLNPGFKYIIK